jgi:hypothetical protein
LQVLAGCLASSVQRHSRRRVGSLQAYLRPTDTALAHQLCQLPSTWASPTCTSFLFQPPLPPTPSHRHHPSSTDTNLSRVSTSMKKASPNSHSYRSHSLLGTKQSAWPLSTLQRLESNSDSPPKQLNHHHCFDCEHACSPKWHNRRAPLPLDRCTWARAPVFKTNCEHCRRQYIDQQSATSSTFAS